MVDSSIHVDQRCARPQTYSRRPVFADRSWRSTGSGRERPPVGRNGSRRAVPGPGRQGEAQMRTHKGCSASGLEGIVVAETDLSEVDGEAGRLVIGGYEVEALTGHVTFEDVCALLWDGALPDAAGRERVRQALAEGRSRAAGLLPEIGNGPGAADGVGGPQPAG